MNYSQDPPRGAQVHLLGVPFSTIVGAQRCEERLSATMSDGADPAFLLKSENQNRPDPVTLSCQ
jgi:hypothetical protein